jgi:vancomycin resistance protein YoaR
VSTDSTAAPQSNDRRGAWLALVGLVVLLAVLYAAGVVFVGNRIPPGTEVSGVDIGGLSGDDARSRLDADLAQRATRTIRLTSGDEHIDVNPARAGLSIDVDATVDEAGGDRIWNPVQMVDVLLGAEDVAPVVDVDERALDAQVAEVVGRFDKEPVEGAVTFTRTGGRQVTRPEGGRAVDPDATAQVLRDAFANGERRAELPVRELRPSMRGDEFQTALGELAGPAVSGPITLLLGDESAKLRVRAFAPALSFTVDNGELIPEIDVERLSPGVEQLADQIGSAPQNATVKLSGGVPVVVPDRPGLALRAADVAEAILPALSKTGDERRVEVGTAVAKADVTTRDAKALKIAEPVSSFVTYFPYAEYRNINQSRAAELINGTVLAPGETFSFNDTVGERTAENGFVPGFIISNGVFREELGGGVSQVVTTTYNAAFFAGLEDVEHKPHSFYIDRYPLGREATVAWPTVDLKFRNNTPYGVLIQAWVVDSTPSSQGAMHVRMWSTKYWDITAGVSERYNFTSPSTRYDSTDACVPTTGYGGFDVDVTRYVRRVGSSRLIRTEVDNVTYTPADNVICS